MKRLRRIILAAAPVLMILMANLANAEHIEKQSLVKGQAVSIDTDYEIGEVAISNNNICDFMITESRHEIYLNPKEEGVATLTIWGVDGEKKDVVPVEIFNSDLSDIKTEAEAIFRDSNITVAEDGRRIVLAGEATSKIEIEEAAALARRHKSVENRVVMSGEVLHTVAGSVEAAIKTPGIKVRNIRGTLALEGVAYSSSSAKRAMEIARLYEPGIINLLEVKETGRRPGQDKLVQLDFYFMEIKKEALRSIGVSWAPGSAAGAGSAAGGGFVENITNAGTSILGFVFNLLPKLKFLREHGDARVLDNATLVVKSGETADFFNGTQVPFYSGEKVQFKDVGVKIHAEPIEAGANVDLVMNATLSSLAANIDAGIDTRTISTSAYIKAGQSVILANMVSNREVTTYNKLPSGLDTTSALFTLSRSKDYQSGRSEFVVFVRPTVLDSALPAEEELKKYLQIEEDSISKRSVKEYQEFMYKQGRPPKAAQKRGKKGRRGW